jgi:hypothetical protein
MVYSIKGSGKRGSSISILFSTVVRVLLSYENDTRQKQVPINEDAVYAARCRRVD